MRAFGVTVLAGLVLSAGSARAQSGDLTIVRAAVLDVLAGQVQPNRTIVISAGVITAIRGPGESVSRSGQILDARGRLTVPGFIDGHFHLCSVFCPPGSDSLAIPMDPAGIAAARRRFAAEYLSYGVTGVRDVGSAESARPLLLAWQKRTADAPDFFPSGAHLISPRAGSDHGR